MTVLPRLVGVSGTPTARQMRIAGATHAGYSTITDYPLGIAKVIPYKVHLAIDAAGALAVAATPFVTGQFHRGPKQWVPHVALCAFELASLAMSDPTGLGDYHGDVEKIRQANMADPNGQIRENGRAVHPPVTA
jgi:hypothetical protein